MYNSILVPVESSHIAESAATLELAQRNGGENCKIRLLNVFEEIPKWAAVNLPKHVVNDSIQALFDATIINSAPISSATSSIVLYEWTFLI